MQSPLDILVKLRYLIFFIVLEAVCLVLVHRNGELRENVAFTTAGCIAGFVNDRLEAVTDYFGLKNENARLVDEVAALKSRMYELRDSVELGAMPESSGTQIAARVVNNTVNRDRNYITVDKGTADGISVGMGVSGLTGAVGTVCKVSGNYSLVMPLVNVNSNVSCKVVGEECFGFLKWNGGDVSVAVLVDLPSHSGVEAGDTVVTSGYSDVFRKGIPVGVVSRVVETDMGSPEITVNLCEDFYRIEYVFIDTQTVPSELTELADY